MEKETLKRQKPQEQFAEVKKEQANPLTNATPKEQANPLTNANENLKLSQWCFANLLDKRKWKRVMDVKTILVLFCACILYCALDIATYNVQNPEYSYLGYYKVLGIVMFCVYILQRVCQVEFCLRNKLGEIVYVYNSGNYTENFGSQIWHSRVENGTAMIHKDQIYIPELAGNDKYRVTFNTRNQFAHVEQLPDSKNKALALSFVEETIVLFLYNNNTYVLENQGIDAMGEIRDNRWKVKAIYPNIRPVQDELIIERQRQGNWCRFYKYNPEKCDFDFVAEKKLSIHDIFLYTHTKTKPVGLV